MTMRTQTAATAVALMRAGHSLNSAIDSVVQDLLNLQGGTIGPVVVHGMDNHGNVYVIETDKSLHTPYFVLDGSTGHIEERIAR